MSGLDPDGRRPGRMAPIPPLDDDGLGGTLDDLAGFQLAGLDMVLRGLRVLALTRLTPKQTTNALVALTGDSDGVSVVTAIGQLVERLTSTTNPALSHIEDEVAKEVAVLGERYRYELTEYGPQGHIAEAVARIHGI